MNLTVDGVLSHVQQLTETFTRDRQRRQGAPALSADDFAAVAETGFHQLLVPESLGGLWTSTAASTRAVATAISMLAAGDSSLAMVLSMEPVALVVAGWLADIEASPERVDDDWRAQRERFLTTLSADGTAWGVLLSERGGVIRSTATPSADGTWSMTGEKLAGSGWDHVSFMLTAAVPDGEKEADAFVIDLRDRPNLRGAEISQPWDGHGMTSSSSHAIKLNGVPVERIAWPDRDNLIASTPSNPMAAARLAPFVGIVRAAMATAAERLDARGGTRGSLEASEWARAQADGWLVDQAFEGVLRATETSRSATDFDRESKIAKFAVSELAESTLQHVSRTLGGSTYSKSSPIGWWREDVRAMGLIRPTLATVVDDLNVSRTP